MIALENSFNNPLMSAFGFRTQPTAPTTPHCAEFGAFAGLRRKHMLFWSVWSAKKK
jgi:hypothetical protein